MWLLQELSHLASSLSLFPFLMPLNSSFTLGHHLLWVALTLTAFFSSTFDNVPREEYQITPINCNSTFLMYMLYYTYMWLLWGRTQYKTSSPLFALWTQNKNFSDSFRICFSIPLQIPLAVVFQWLFAHSCRSVRNPASGILVNSETANKSKWACPNPTQITLYEWARTSGSHNAFIPSISTINWMSLPSSVTWVTHMMAVAAQNTLQATLLCWKLLQHILGKLDSS